jgi:hypothetical protein
MNSKKHNSHLQNQKEKRENENQSIIQQKIDEKNNTS